LPVSFLIDNALSFRDDKGPFDTVVDSGLFHVFDDDDRRRYVENLSRLTKSGGSAFILCFSTDEPGDWGPRRVSKAELEKAFQSGWRVKSIEPRRYENFNNADGSHAWLASLQRS
jgi:cyclopropane fatty-acyl-phospholipid synthase-like methyltransferase